MLHITNGTSVALAQAVPGRVLVWKDVLHEGPVPAGLSLRQMSDVRARFIADCGWGRYAAVRRDFAARDRALTSFRRHGEVVLWFEHDLFDQLQLIQILDWFSARDLGKTKLSLINVDQYLGWLRAEQLASLFPKRRRVTRALSKLGSEGWSAFCSTDPTTIERFLTRDTSALPFLKGALHRQLEEFPSTRNGLSRTERQALDIIEKKSDTWPRVFLACRDREDAVFLGDMVFRLYLDRLARCRHALIKLNGFKVSITKTGRDVLAGRADHVRLNGIDRWIGGVHLNGATIPWRWDERRKRLVA